ncbi:hypothetical protein [Methanopyrus sp.]
MSVVLRLPEIADESNIDPGVMGLTLCTVADVIPADRNAPFLLRRALCRSNSSSNASVIDA